MLESRYRIDCESNLMHVLIIGRSGSGKSNLARCLAGSLPNESRIVVYDPTESLGWPENAAKYSDPESFLTDIFQERSAHVFVDECKTLWDHDEKRASQLVYRLRHNGLLFYLIAQRAMGMVPPNARNQCSSLIAFRTSAKDAEILGAEYGESILGAAKLPQGYAIYSDGFANKKIEMIYDEDEDGNLMVDYCMQDYGE